jgi:hypothetical protein
VRIQIVPAAAANHMHKLMEAVDAHVAACSYTKSTDKSITNHTKRRIAGVMIGKLRYSLASIMSITYSCEHTVHRIYFD